MSLQGCSGTPSGDLKPAFTAKTHLKRICGQSWWRHASASLQLWCLYLESMWQARKEYTTTRRTVFSSALSFSFPLSLSLGLAVAVLQQCCLSGQNQELAAVQQLSHAAYCYILQRLLEIVLIDVNATSPAPQHCIRGREQWLDYTSQYLDG